MSNKAACHVYLIGTEKDGKLSSPVKVGITTSVHSRLKTLQTGSALPLVLGAYLSTPNRQVALAMEACFHHIFAGKRMSGEWFDMPPADALKGLCDTFASAFDHFISGDDEAYAAACEQSGLNAAIALHASILRGEATVQ